MASGSSDSKDGIQMSSSESPQEKGGRNKRKFRMEIADPTKLNSPFQTDSSTFELSSEKCGNSSTDEDHGISHVCSKKQDDANTLKQDFGSSVEAGSSKQKEDTKSQNYRYARWSDLTKSELEELLLNLLHKTFESAINRITVIGYSKEIATRAILRYGICYGSNDPITNIVETTLAFMRSAEQIDGPRGDLVETLEELKKYTMIEMVSVLRQVKPVLSVADAMWRLLLCDLDMNLACKMADNSFTSVNASTADPGFSSSGPDQSKLDEKPKLPCTSDVLEGLPPEKTNPVPKFDSKGKSTIDGDHVQTSSQSSTPPVEPVPGNGRKGRTSKTDHVLQQKSMPSNKKNRGKGAKGSAKKSNSNSSGGLILDKKQDSTTVSKSVAFALKHTSVRITQVAGVDISQTKGLHAIAAPLSSNTKPSGVASALLMSNTDLSFALAPKKNIALKPPSSSAASSHDDMSYIPYARINEIVPDCKKDEVIAKMLLRKKELENEIEEWTSWGNEKVMQVARRLGQDKAEMKSLRHQKEETARLKRERQQVEEASRKRLSDIHHELNKADFQIATAKVSAEKLKTENKKLIQKMEAAKIMAEESAAACSEAAEKEKKTQQQLQSSEKKKALMQEELATQRLARNQLQQEVDQAKEYLDWLEANRRAEETTKNLLLAQAYAIREETLQIKAASKLNEKLILSKAEQDLKQSKEYKQKLENEIAQLKLKNESSALAALRQGADGKNVSNGIGSLEMDRISGLMAGLDIKQGKGVMKRERECVMCLSEERIVVFLPCAHQVVCAKCSKLHEEQGMKDCPSCRTPIQQRIVARFRDS